VQGVAFRLALVSFLFGTLYIILVIILHKGLTPIHQLIRLSRGMIPQRWFSKLSRRTGTAPVEDDALDLAPAGQ
jgi:hypothetical protein